MTASLSVLPETAREEARYAELKRKLDELQRQFKLQEVQELASFEAKLKAIDEQADQLRNEITAQLSDSPIREKIEKVIGEKRDLEAAEARRRYQEQKDERKKRYDSEKKRYKEEAYIVTTRLMKYGVRCRSICFLDPAPCYKLPHACPDIARAKHPLTINPTVSLERAIRWRLRRPARGRSHRELLHKLLLLLTSPTLLSLHLQNHLQPGLHPRPESLQTQSQQRVQRELRLHPLIQEVGF